MAFNLDEYVDVAERLQQFYKKYPEGRITRSGRPEVMTVGESIFITYTAYAYRDPEDKLPAIGTAWEPFPGKTQFTRDSELMNAETAAWGRAIIAAGIPSKKIASREEAQARKPESAQPPYQASDITPPEQTRVSETMYERLKEEFAAAGSPAIAVGAWLDENDVPAGANLAGRIAQLRMTQAVRLSEFIESLKGEEVTGQEVAA